MINSIGEFGGMKVIVNKFLTYRARRIARRTWQERIFSHPCVSRKVVVIDAPSRMYYLITKENTVVCHPIMEKRLRKAVSDER